MTLWRKYNGSLIPDQPPHILVDDSENVIAKKIKEHNSYFARWTSNFDCHQQTDFWYVINDRHLKIEDYSKNTRSKIRRGLKNCIVKVVSLDEIKEFGYECYKYAFENYNTHLQPKSNLEFADDLDTLDREWEFWGVFFDGKLIGYSQNRIVKDYCDYSTIKFHPKYLKYYPSYALFFSMNAYYLNEMKFKYINDGARSISHETNIQEFLIQKFQFRKAYCKLHLSYSYKFKIIILLLYPLKSIIGFFNNTFAKKVSSVLKQEAIRRSFL